MSVYPPDAKVQKFATISGDGKYRYSLLRYWSGNGPLLTFAMLNPSTADAEKDDNTIRRCVDFAVREGFAGIRVVNLYAFRATKPADMFRAAAAGVDVTGGERNDDLLAECGRRVRHGEPLIAAWGIHARRDRVARVLTLPGWDNLRSLGVTKGGSPRHPLMVRSDTPLTSWRAAS